MEPTFLPYPEATLAGHFLGGDADRLSVGQHLAKWRKRIDDAPTKDPAFLQRDETLWTAGALLAFHYADEATAHWRNLAERLFGPAPPESAGASWRKLIDGDLQLFFEVGLSSPRPYREWLAANAATRHSLIEQVKAARDRGFRLEGHTQLDALLLAPDTGFALHFESKVLSDIDPKTTFDSLRNQLARNLDCMVQPPPKTEPLKARDPERSFLVLLTPGLFRDRPQSRLYGHLLREYRDDAGTIGRDLPHLSMEVCEAVRRRIGWLTFEDIRSEVPGACPWLPAPSGQTPSST